MTEKEYALILCANESVSRCMWAYKCLRHTVPQRPELAYTFREFKPVRDADAEPGECEGFVLDLKGGGDAA